MKLTVFERMALFSILPKEGDFTTLKTVRKLREALALSEEENKIFGVDQANRKWDPSADRECDVEIGEMADELIVRTLKKLDEDKKLKEGHFTLYEKFVES